MSGRKPKLKPDQVALIREWWHWRRIQNKVMCARLGIEKGTLLKVIRREGAYRC